MSSNSPLKNPFVLLGLFALGCVGTVIVMAILRQNAQALACRNSLELVAVLEYVPYELRADALASVVPTMNKLYDCVVTWFETDDTLREYNLFKMEVSEDGATLSGLTNWVSFRILLNHPDNYDRECLGRLNDFFFVPTTEA